MENHGVSIFCCCMILSSILLTRNIFLSEKCLINLYYEYGIVQTANPRFLNTFIFHYYFTLGTNLSLLIAQWWYPLNYTMTLLERRMSIYWPLMKRLDWRLQWQPSRMFDIYFYILCYVLIFCFRIVVGCFMFSKIRGVISYSKLLVWPYLTIFSLNCWVQKFEIAPFISNYAIRNFILNNLSTFQHKYCYNYSLLF